MTTATAPVEMVDARAEPASGDMIACPEELDTQRRDGLDLPTLMMGMGTEEQTAALTEYASRRKNFVSWLFSQLIEGIHYGTPPGCEVATAGVTDDGRTVYGTGWDPQSKKWKHTFTEDQWRPHKNLYKAGADLIVNLMGWRCDFEFDSETVAAVDGSCVAYICRLRTLDGTGVGMGRGLRNTGEKGMQPSANVKMAQKCAKVDAVLNALGLSDIFTQDMEDESSQFRPPEDRGGPNEQGRGTRLKNSEWLDFMEMVGQATGHMDKAGRAEFMKTLAKLSGVKFDEFAQLRNRGTWSRTSVEVAKERIAIFVEGGEWDAVNEPDGGPEETAPDGLFGEEDDR